LYIFKFNSIPNFNFSFIYTLHTHSSLEIKLYRVINQCISHDILMLWPFMDAGLLFIATRFDSTILYSPSPFKMIKSKTSKLVFTFIGIRLFVNHRVDPESIPHDHDRHQCECTPFLSSLPFLVQPPLLKLFFFCAVLIKNHGHPSYHTLLI